MSGFFTSQKFAGFQPSKTMSVHFLCTLATSNSRRQSLVMCASRTVQLGMPSESSTPLNIIVHHRHHQWPQGRQQPLQQTMTTLRTMKTGTATITTTMTTKQQKQQNMEQKKQQQKHQRQKPTTTTTTIVRVLAAILKDSTHSNHSTHSNQTCRHRHSNHNIHPPQHQHHHLRQNSVQKLIKHPETSFHPSKPLPENVKVMNSSDNVPDYDVNKYGYDY